MNDEIALYNISQKVIQAKQDLTRNYLVLGGLLSEVRENELWAHDDYTSFEAYLADPDICMSISTASRMINTFEVFIKHYEIGVEEMQKIDYSKVTEILPVVKRKTMTRPEVINLLSEIRDMTVRDIRIHRKEVDGIRADECEHDWVERKHWTCSRCGVRVWTNPGD
ncbi:MAG: hypothetical protein WC248_06850 [Candidatus Methanomethylophilaceae archaeon]|jgi:hypothetical protein